MTSSSTPTLPPKAVILVAEDAEDMRHLVADALREEGYVVIEVDDGRDLLIKLCAMQSEGGGAPPGVAVVSDVRMPALDGLSVAAALRARGWETPFVFMTAFGDEDVHARARALGALALDKPFQLTELRKAVSLAVALGRDGEGAP